MGVVFGLFAGFYYWFDIVLGVKYSEDIAKLHFWLTFVGVNMTFFPQHFLGLAGMPRRIPDYPDIYYGWNYLSSIGSLVSVIGIIVFFLVVLQAVYRVCYYSQKKNSFYFFIEDQFDFSFSKKIESFVPQINEVYTAKTYVFEKYNFFNVFSNYGLLYIYLDRYLLSIFLYNFSNIWIIDNLYSDIFKNTCKINLNNPWNISNIFSLNSLNNSLIVSFLFLFKGWLSLFIYYVCILSKKKIYLLLQIQLLNLFFFKFLGYKKNNKNYFFLFLRKVNLLQKISLFF